MRRIEISHAGGREKRRKLFLCYNRANWTMDFTQLTTFLEVAKSASFSRAGKTVFLSQPAVSAQIRQLELEYGTRLLDRQGKKVRLTVAGDALLEYAAAQ
jgi:DNA-binding transcriptional LysR family regulator